jgi:hypothetical protein
MEKPCMKQPDTTMTGINGIEVELMLNPLKAQLDKLEQTTTNISIKLDSLIHVTLAWNESIDNINEHLKESMGVIKDHVGLVEDSDVLINIEEFILKSSYEKDEEDEKVLHLNPELFNGGESSDK